MRQASAAASDLGALSGKTSLYFSAVVQCGAALNWNATHFILGRAWYAASWRTREGLRLAQMVSAHLDAVRPGRAA